MTLPEISNKYSIFVEHRFMEKIVMSGERPLSLLYNSRNSTVLVRLRGGRMLRGVLRGFDTHMNLILDESEEILEDGTTKARGTIVVRGDNVVLIAPVPR